MRSSILLKIAHRGARLEATENSLAAFAKAIEMGADMVELDVQVTSGGELVVIHDPWIDRVTNGKANVRDLSLKELQNFQTAEGESVPTLEQVYDLCRGKVQVLTEIKTVEIGKKIAELIARKNMGHEVIVQSFLHGELLRFREFDQKTRTAVLFDELLFDAYTLSAYIGSLQANGAILPFKSLRRDLVQAMHQRDFFVYCWGGDVDEVAALDVDGFVTVM